jgi:hypothetical protein
MRQADGRKRLGRPSPALVVAIIALIAALGGSAIAAKHKKLVLPKNSVGTRQIKSKAITAGKIARNAVTGAKVADHSLSGADINLAALGTVPQAQSADHAASADSLSGHAAACPAGTTLIRGICFDSSSSGPAPTVMAAADACAARGGWLPSPMELYATRSVLNLGTGVGSDHMYTDAIYNTPGGGNYRTIVVDGTGTQPSESELTAPSRYICAYPLVR